MFTQIFRSAALTSWLAMSSASAAIAAPLAEITLENQPFQTQEISAETVRVVVDNYQPLNFEDSEIQYFSYAIYIDNELKYQEQQAIDFTFGSISLEHLDPDGVPEVLYHKYSGGAHCCSTYTVMSWQSDRLHQLQTYPLDASAAGAFDDIDGDGYSELLSSDYRFLYTFSSYASSWPPIIILSFREGTLIDVTQQFPQRLRSHAYRMYEQTRESTLTDPKLGVNGILAGYVAQKILLGEYESGWNYMLAHYDPTDTWGLTSTNREGDVVQTYADYPTALSAFLQEMDYLLDANTPNADLDLSQIIVETESVQSF